MGRAARYLTHEERLSARRARYASKAQDPEATAAKKRYNRRYYEKKRGLKLLGEPSLAVAEPIRALAAIEPSSPDFWYIFRQFLEGRDSVSFDEFDIEEEDLEMLTGLPPYPQAVTSISTWDEDWPKLNAAIHGYATRKYLESLDQLTRSSVREREFKVMFDLFERRRRLEFLYERLQDAHQSYMQLGKNAEAMLTGCNKIWICRLLEYNREDIERLKEGLGKFLNIITERRWALGHVAQF